MASPVTRTTSLSPQTPSRQQQRSHEAPELFVGRALVVLCVPVLCVWGRVCMRMRDEIPTMSSPTHVLICTSVDLFLGLTFFSFVFVFLFFLYILGAPHLLVNLSLNAPCLIPHTSLPLSHQPRPISVRSPPPHYPPHCSPLLSPPRRQASWPSGRPRNNNDARHINNDI